MLSGFTSAKIGEVYTCSMPLRRVFELISKQKNEFLTKSPKTVLLAYFAGLIDGDGCYDYRNSDLRIFYSIMEKEDVICDSSLLLIIGTTSSISERRNHFRLQIHKPKDFASMIKPFSKVKCVI